MEGQAEISAERLDRKVGSRLKVLVDAVDADGAVARSSADAPEIDGVVYLETVSYTHLDVYKRQVLAWSPPRGRRSRCAPPV